MIEAESSQHGKRNLYSERRLKQQHVKKRFRSKNMYKESKANDKKSLKFRQSKLTERTRSKPTRKA